MLIITGTIAYDYIMDFPGNFGDHILPSQTHNINLSFIVSNFAKRRGGTAGNVSYTLGLLHTHNLLYSVAGQDFADYKKSFKKLPIDLSHVVIDKEKYTSTGFAMTDKKDNQIWGYFYGAADEIKNMQLSKVVKKNDIVLIGPSGAAGSLSLVRQAVNVGVSYIFDPGFILTQVSDEELTFGVSYADYVIGNDYEITLMQKRIPAWQEIAAEKIIITTYGAKGAKIVAKSKEYMIDPVMPKGVVDPTGAGDAWRAGFLAGLERNFDLQICGQMGSTSASYALEQYGTQEHKFSPEEFSERYSRTFEEKLSL